MPDEREKAALSSVAASIFLTAFKAIVSIITGSLGILSEAANSGLDIGSDLTTYYAVKTSMKPPDKTHHYGYGKIESLAGFIQVGLILITCFWIVYEALTRLFSGFHQVEASFVGFAVMIFSIIVNIWRSRLLHNMARKYESQALEAGALNFTTDILTSLVVIVGLLFVRLGYPVVDSLAALGVAFFVVLTSLRLGMRTINVLLDRAPKEIARQIEREIRAVEGVIDCHHLRVRSTGVKTFIDMHVCIDGSTSLDRSHEIASAIERRIRSFIPSSDIVVHMEPVLEWTESSLNEVRSIALQIPKVRNIHDIRMHEIDGRIYIDLDMELDGTLRLREAHELVSLFEEKVKAKIKDIAEISTHIEPVKERPAYGEDVTKDVPSIVEEASGIALQVPGVKDCHHIAVLRIGYKYYATIHCHADEDLSLEEAHEIGNKVERLVTERVKDVAHVSVHIEPLTTEA